MPGGRIARTRDRNRPRLARSKWFARPFAAGGQIREGVADVKVSVIMRTKNSDWVVAQALEGLFAQSFRDFELFVVDSGSTDRTLEIVGRYPAHVRRIAARDYYPGQVLNEAIRAVSGDVLVFQNSDVIPQVPDALARLLAPLADPAVVATFARQVPRPEALGWVRRDLATAFPAAGPAPAWMTYALPFAAMRRSAWEAHPFFTDAWGSEDSEWGAWATRTGHAIRYVPEALVMHSHNYTLREILGRRFIEGEADAFIHRDRDSVWRMLRRVTRSTLSDALALVRARDLSGLAAAPVRRAAYHLGYYRGHKHGERRLAENDTDTRTGQRMVLEWFGGAGTSERRPR